VQINYCLEQLMLLLINFLKHQGNITCCNCGNIGAWNEVNGLDKQSIPRAKIKSEAALCFVTINVSLSSIRLA
jgi:hypothetical protein